MIELLADGCSYESIIDLHVCECSTSGTQLAMKPNMTEQRLEQAIPVQDFAEEVCDVWSKP